MNIVVIGDGSAGKRHAAMLVQRGHSVTIWGPDARPTIGNSAHLFIDVQAAVVASPPEWHETHLDFLQHTHLDFLQHVGKPIHILCEGPMTKLTKPAAAVRMMASNWRFVPAMQKLQERLQRPVMAHFWFDYDLYRWRQKETTCPTCLGTGADIQGVCSTCGGTSKRQVPADMRKTCYYHSGHHMINVHEADLALWLLGPVESSHVEYVHTGKSKSVDGFVLSLKHMSGALSTINSSWHASRYERGLRIVECDGSTHEMRWGSPDDDGTVNNSYEAMIDHWLRAIEEKNYNVEPSFQDGYAAFQLLRR